MELARQAVSVALGPAASQALDFALSHPDTFARAAQLASKGVQNVTSYFYSLASGSGKKSKRKKRARLRKQSKLSALSMPGAMPVFQRQSRQSATYSAPYAVTRVERQSYGKLADYIVSHREYLQDLPGSVAFELTSFRLNPAELTTFPWLSRIATSFEKYKFTKLAFSVSSMAPATSTGSIVLAYEYDPSDAVPTSKRDMLQYDGATRTAPWKSVDVVYANKDEPDDLLYVDPVFSNNIAIRRQNDMGTFLVACEGQADTSKVAELWVDYSVRFVAPQPKGVCYSANITGTGFANGTAPVVTSSTISGGIFVQIIIVAQDIKVLWLPAGYWAVHLDVGSDPFLIADGYGESFSHTEGPGASYTGENHGSLIHSATELKNYHTTYYVKTNGLNQYILIEPGDVDPTRSNGIWHLVLTQISSEVYDALP
jgi:hypothetical protein